MDPNYFISQDVLFISKPCSVIRSLMHEFHTSVNRIIFKAAGAHLEVSAYPENKIIRFIYVLQ